MDSALHDFLLSEVPGWDDDNVSAARFKALTGQRADWEPRFRFWKDLIVKVARHLNLLIIDVHTVQHSWFLRGGLTPLCLNQVLTEMYRDGDLQNLDKRDNFSNLVWFWQTISKVFWGKDEEGAIGIESRLFVTSLAHERLMRITNSVSESCWSSSCVLTIAHFIELADGEEEAEVLKKVMMQSKRGQTFTTQGNILLEGVKISLTHNSTSEISSLDCYLLQAYWTVEKLNSAVKVIETSYNKSKQCALRCIQMKDRKNAKKYAYTMRRLSASKEKCLGFQQKIQDLLAFVLEAEMNKQVFEAMKAGKDALKQHRLPLDDVYDCLHEVDEAIALHKEMATALVSGYEEDSDVEFMEQEFQILSEESNMCTIQTDVSSLNIIKDVQSSSVEDVEHVFRHLTLKAEV